MTMPIIDETISYPSPFEDAPEEIAILNQIRKRFYAIAKHLEKDQPTAALRFNAAARRVELAERYCLELFTEEKKNEH
jgi:hypothetical protein